MPIGSRLQSFQPVALWFEKSEINAPTNTVIIIILFSSPMWSGSHVYLKKFPFVVFVFMTILLGKMFTVPASLKRVFHCIYMSLATSIHLYILCDIQYVQQTKPSLNLILWWVNKYFENKSTIIIIMDNFCIVINTITNASISQLHIYHWFIS